MMLELLGLMVMLSSAVVQPGSAANGDILVVKVTASYSRPSSFSRDPPSYRAASDLTLSCEVEATNDDEHDIEVGLFYEWRSTCSGNCFVRGGSTKTISTPYLHSYDAGVHTCVVYDTLGCTGNASITVNVVGAGIYVESGDQVLSNNSVIANINQVIPNFRCLSGSNTSNIGSLIGPLGKDITRSTSDPFLVMRGSSHDPGTLLVRSLRSLEPEESGIYTYRTPNEAGNIIDFNVGLYSTEKSSSPVCSDFTSSLTDTLPFVLSCYSSKSPPTRVIWGMDNYEIYIQENSSIYTSTQTLVDRSTSAYNNTLTINTTIEDVIGEYTFTVINSIGISETCTKNIKAVEVKGHETPVIVGLSGSINCSTSLQVVRMEWVLVGVGDAVEERDDGGQSLTLPLEPETTGLNGAKFTCRVTTKNGKKFEETVTVQVKELVHTVSIDGPANPLPAGGSYSVNCTAVSDLPTSIKWLDPSDKEVTPSGSDVWTDNPSTEGNVTILMLHFDPIKTSHGGVYTCISTVSEPLSYKRTTRNIIVQITPSRSVLVRTPSGSTVFTADRLNLTCITTLNPAVDTRVRVTHRWVGPNGNLTAGSGTAISQVTGSGPDYISTVEFNSLRSSDSGSYNCYSIVYSEPSSSSIVASEEISSTTNFKAAIRVTISISYTLPDQYPDYAPPNYRAASSVTLTCVASGTTGHVTYRWSSTCGSCFASSSSSQTITESILRSRDAGMHTCSVTDSLGNTGSDVTTMNIVGAGIYVSNSVGTGTGESLGAQPNNSYAIVGKKNYYDSIRYQIYCCSNSSSSTGTITLPNGLVRTSSYGQVNINRYTGSATYAGCIQIYYSYAYYYSFIIGTTYRGIFTFNILDSNGVNIPVSIGLYAEGFTSPPSMYYFQYNIDSRNSSKALIARTSTAPPTNITIYKDNKRVDIDKSTIQINTAVTNRYYTYNYYDIIITICDSPENIIGDYTLEVGNRFGTDNDIISIHGLGINCSSSEFIVGETFTCNCSSDLDAVSIEWYQGNSTIPLVTDDSTGSIEVQATIEGQGETYTCSANNICGSQEDTVTIQVIVPDGWASVATINSTGANALHGTEYTLLCTVTAIPGMTLPPSVEWVGPDGDVIEESDRNRTLGGVVTRETVSTLSLTFNPVLSSDGGRYTCRTSVNVPWMDRQPPNISNAVDMPVTTQALFQLKMFPVAHCSNWDVSTARDVETSIKREVEKAIRERCECDFISTAIYSGEFSCQSSNCKSSCSLGTQVTYRAILNGTSDFLTAGQLMDHIEDWRESRGTLLYNLFRLRLAKKNECQLSIDSFDENEC